MNIKKKGIKSEKRAAKKVKGKIIKGSGCLWYNRGDYETEKYVFQNKCSENYYQLNLNDLNKAKKDAISKNKDFIFSIELKGDFYYIFERILIEENKEKELNLTPIIFKKSIKINEKKVETNLLMNEKYILVDEYNFQRLKLE